VRYVGAPGEWININEIEAFGTEYCALNSETNLLLGMPVTTSPSLTANFAKKRDDVVDGVACAQAGGTDTTGNNMWHSAGGGGVKYLQVEPIKCKAVIDRVVVINRCNANSNRITGAKVFVIDEAGTKTQCGAPLTDAGPGMPMTVTCPEAAGISVGVRLELDSG
jgi:hypothetical protein